jgi:hypothetical protein
MTSFYVCKVLKNPTISIAETVVYGDVEIRPSRSCTVHEKEVLAESIKATKCESEVNLAFGCLIGVIVEADSSDDADALADRQFVEVLDLLTVEYTMSQLVVAQCGYVKNLETGTVHSISKQVFDFGTLFVRRLSGMPQINNTQRVLHRTGELVDRYRKSIYWSRYASIEKSVHLSLLYRWFALEALFKENEGDDVTSPLMLFLGFPGSTYSQNISRDLLRRLSEDTAYSKWKKQMKALVDEIRNFRNDSVHAGFRSVDCTTEKLRLYGRVMSVGLPRCQGAVLEGIFNGLSSVPELKAYAGILFEDRANVESDILGTVVHILDNDHMEHVQPTHK